VRKKTWSWSMERACERVVPTGRGVEWVRWAVPVRTGELVKMTVRLGKWRGLQYMARSHKR